MACGEADSHQRSAGTLFRGAPLKHAPCLKGTCSIPAKFETVLFSGPRERKGFGSDRKRFTGADHDLPGPGAYDLGTPSLEFKHDSIGKKGFGSMVSRGRRFTTARTAYTGPGPGTYTAQLPHTAPANFSRAAQSAAFQSKASASVAPVDSAVDTVPGPGTYTVTETRTGQSLDSLSRHGATSAFKATPHQSVTSGNLETPPPTTYTLADPWNPAYSSPRASSSARPSYTSAFAASHKQPASTINSLPALLYGPDAPEAREESGPGPGSYDIEQHGSIQRNLGRITGKLSAPFHPAEFVDKFGRPIHRGRDRSVPKGFAPSEPLERTASPSRPPVSAPFKSQAPGHAEYIELMAAAKAAPGPAYYKVSGQPSKRSFHLNARKMYTSA